MQQLMPYVITISRQLGCGGSLLGRRLAENLGFFYADREIISKAAEQLSILEHEAEARDEKTSSFWNTFFQYRAFTADMSVPQRLYFPTDLELFEVESDIILRMAEKHSAVIIGRCGFHLLRNYPNHLSIFLHASEETRRTSVKKTFEVSDEEAAKIIAKNDKERVSYCRSFTGKDHNDARNYHMTFDTGKIGIDTVLKLILAYVEIHWGGPGAG